jgi:hypothetical protein
MSKTLLLEREERLHVAGAIVQVTRILDSEFELVYIELLVFTAAVTGQDDFWGSGMGGEEIMTASWLLARDSAQNLFDETLKTASLWKTPTFFGVTRRCPRRDVDHTHLLS